MARVELYSVISLGVFRSGDGTPFRVRHGSLTLQSTLGSHTDTPSLFLLRPLSLRLTYPVCRPPRGLLVSRVLGSATVGPRNVSCLHYFDGFRAPSWWTPLVFILLYTVSARLGLYQLGGVVFENTKGLGTEPLSLSGVCRGRVSVDCRIFVLYFPSVTKVLWTDVGSCL